MAELDEKINALLSDPDSMAKIMQLAQSLSGSSGSSESQQAPQGPWSASSPPPSPQQAAPAFSPAGSGGGGDPLSALTGGLDPQLLMRLLPLVQELGSGQDTNARRLVYALRPYLKPERQDKVERALGEERASRFHSHFSRIEFTPNGGEKRHRTFADHGGFGPDWAPLAREVARRGWSPTFICESAGTQAEDAVEMKKIYQSYCE